MSLQQLVRIISERRIGTILWELNDIRESKVETEILMEQLLHTAFTVYNVLYMQPQLMAYLFPSNHVGWDTIPCLDESAVHKNQLGLNHTNTI